MPYRKEEFINDGIYHTILRGIDNNLIFKDTDDYYRGIFSIYEFNNSQPTTIQEKRRERSRYKKNIDRRRTSIESSDFVDRRDRLVDILTFCFMPNHIHLLLKQIKTEGLRNFMIKLGSGYGRYFNQKYERKGYVFQNRFRSVPIKDDNQLMTVVNYIHLNPVSIIEPNFKEKGIKNHSVQEVMNFLKTDYRWSGYLDYIGIKNFPSVTERDFLLELMGGQDGLIKNITDWISHKKDLSQFGDILLE